MKTEELLGNILPEWRKAFTHFVETGDAEEEFLAYLNNDEKARQAVEAAFNAQAAAFQAMAEELKAAKTQDPLEKDPADCRYDVSSEIVLAVEDVLQLPPNRRKEIVRETVAVLPLKQQKLALETLMHALGKKATSKPTVAGTFS